MCQFRPAMVKSKRLSSSLPSTPELMGQEQRKLIKVYSPIMGDETLTAASHSTRPLPSSWNRVKRVFLAALLAALTVKTLPYIASEYLPSGFGLHACHSSRNSAEDYLGRAERLLHRVPLIDGHNDLLIRMREQVNNRLFETDGFYKQFKDGGFNGEVDVPRLEKGLQGGAFWSAFVDCPANLTDLSKENYYTSVRMTLEQIDTFNRLALEFPKYFTLPRSATDALSNFQHHNLHISPLGIEGSHQIGNSMSTLRLFHALGVRYMTLTHDCHTIYADSQITSPAPLHGGLSFLGRQLVREMNRLGMLVDLSHVSAWTMLDAIIGLDHDTPIPDSGPEGSPHALPDDPEMFLSPAWNGSLAPVMFSHSSAARLCPEARNVPDDVLRALGRRGGVVMVNFYPGFLHCAYVGGDRAEATDRFLKPRDNVGGDIRGRASDDGTEPYATVDDVVDHIVYIGDLIGYSHVGLGSDFDGLPSRLPEGIEDVSHWPDLVARMLERGISEENVEKVVGLNILRVWREAGRVAVEMRDAGWKPLEDVVPQNYQS